MKNLIFISILIFLFSNNVQAERLVNGTVNIVDIESGYVVINNTQFKIMHGKTKLLLGNQKLDLGLLEKGNKVSFVPNKILITEIRLHKYSKLEE